MGVTIDSTTDSAADVLAATGGAKPVAEEAKETKSAAPTTEEAETKEESDTPEKDLETDDEKSTDEPEDSESEEDADSESKDEPKPKKNNGFKKRIDKLSRRLSEREQEIEYWKAEALKQKPTETKPVAAAAKTEDKPVADNFETHEEYVDALTDWKIKRHDLDRETKAKEAQVKSEYQKTVETFQSKVAEFSKSNTDFDEVVADVDDIPLPLTVQEAILTSDMGPALMYELSKNREELERITRLSPAAAAREIGKVEARLAKQAESPKEEKKLTKAPPPLNPVGSKGSVKAAKSPEDMDFQEYKRWRVSKK